MSWKIITEIFKTRESCKWGNIYLISLSFAEFSDSLILTRHCIVKLLRVYVEICLLRSLAHLAQLCLPLSCHSLYGSISDVGRKIEKRSGVLVGPLRKPLFLDKLRSFLRLNKSYRTYFCLVTKRYELSISSWFCCSVGSLGFEKKWKEKSSLVLKRTTTRR